MTEEEWLACGDPDSMLYFLRSAVGERKARLFAAACLRRIWPLVTDARSRRIVEVVERHLEGAASDDEWRAASDDARAAWLDSSHRLSPRMYGLPDRPLAAAEREAILVLHSTTTAAHNMGRGAVQATTTPEGRALAHSVARETARAVNPHYPASSERPRQADLLRDLFGNPFRPVAADPNWFTSTVVSLARGIYEERAFDHMPILADALQDAGCEDAGILDHCRGDGPHARGCWVVDLILGKS